jgi:hypothetical protein
MPAVGKTVETRTGNGPGVIEARPLFKPPLQQAEDDDLVEWFSNQPAIFASSRAVATERSMRPTAIRHGAHDAARSYVSPSTRRSTENAVMRMPTS